MAKEKSTVQPIARVTPEEPWGDWFLRKAAVHHWVDAVAATAVAGFLIIVSIALLVSGGVVGLTIGSALAASAFAIWGVTQWATFKYYSPQKAEQRKRQLIDFVARQSAEHSASPERTGAHLFPEEWSQADAFEWAAHACGITDLKDQTEAARDLIASALAEKYPSGLGERLYEAVERAQLLPKVKAKYAERAWNQLLHICNVDHNFGTPDGQRHLAAKLVEQYPDGLTQEHWTLVSRAGLRQQVGAHYYHYAWGRLTRDCFVSVPHSEDARNKLASLLAEKYWGGLPADIRRYVNMLGLGPQVDAYYRARDAQSHNQSLRSERSSQTIQL